MSQSAVTVGLAQKDVLEVPNFSLLPLIVEQTDAFPLAHGTRLVPERGEGDRRGALLA